MKKLFTLVTLALTAISGAWAAKVSDLVAISDNYTFIADDITSNGTTKLTENTLYSNGYIFAPTANSVATNKGKSTINGVEHLNSLRLKNTQDQLCFKVASSCAVTFYTQSHASRGIQVGSSAGGTEFGSQTVSTTEWTVNITKGGTVYLSSFGGDFYFAGFKVVFPKPEITTQPNSATYLKDATATALNVVASASKGDLSYQWYSCEDDNKTNAAAIDGGTNASYTPSTATVGTFYYFCRVSDSNGSTDTKVVSITISNAYAPIVSTTISSIAVLQYETTSLEVSADAVPTATIQWYSCDDAEKANAVAIDGATSTTYSPSTESLGTYYFYAIATNAQGSTSSDVITLTVNADITGQTFYSWNQGTESGGTAVASDGESVGCTNSSYTTIRLNGKTDFSDKTVSIALAYALKAKDVIKVTAYRNKDAEGKQSGFKAKFEKGSSTVASSTGLEYININDAVSSTGEYGTEPNTCVFTVPASAAGSKTITMTRSHTATNLFITKIEIYRPSINFKATLNAAGLLTSDEVTNQSNFSFGLTSSGERVNATAGNAVATISGKYHNDHGCTGLTVTANVTKPVKISIGQCTYSKSQITVKNSNNEDVILLTPNYPSCWKNDNSKVNELFYFGSATTLTISGMTYCPYIAIEEAENADVNVTVTSAGFATLFSPYTLTIPEGINAYTGKLNGNTLVLSKVNDVIPAFTAVVLEANEGDYTFSVAQSEVFTGENDLKGVSLAATIEANSVLVLGLDENDVPGFYTFTGTTLAAGKAYLELSAEAASAPAIYFSFEDETEVTGVYNLRVEEKANAAFDLTGRRANGKGLMIQNGKVVLVK